MTPYERAIVDVVRRAFGEPTDLFFPEEWGPRVVVGASTPVGVVYAKAAGDRDVRAEVTAIGLAGKAGVPVPRVLATGEDPALPGGRWMATAKVDGVPWPVLHQTADAQTLPDLALALAKLHRIHPQGFGPLNAAGHGTFDTWPAWILHTARSALDGLVEAGHATDTFRVLAIEVFKRATPAISRGSLVHSDISESETFIDSGGGRIVGIVDWGDAVVADPVFGLATVLAGGPADDPRPKHTLPAILDRYIPETRMDRAAVERTLPLYQAHHVITGAAWCAREGVPWIDGLLHAAETRLDIVQL